MRSDSTGDDYDKEQRGDNTSDAVENDHSYRCGGRRSPWRVVAIVR